MNMFHTFKIPIEREDMIKLLKKLKNNARHEPHELTWEMFDELVNHEKVLKAFRKLMLEIREHNESLL